MSLFNKDDRAGLYITVIFHLTVIIVLLLYQIDSTVRKEESFVLDFSKQEEIERRQKEEVFREDISRKLDELIAAAHNSSAPIRNIATDASRAQLKDDRGTDAEELYKMAVKAAVEQWGAELPEDYFENPTAAYDGTLKRIMEQKFYALFFIDFQQARLLTGFVFSLLAFQNPAGPAYNICTVCHLSVLLQ